MDHDVDISKIQESPNMSECLRYKLIRAGETYVTGVYGGVARKTADVDYVEFENREGGAVMVPFDTIFDISRDLIDRMNADVSEAVTDSGG